MPIIISKNGQDAEIVDESEFGLEDKLQEYVKNNPDIIPLYEVKADTKLLILSREFMTNSGPIDALGVDQNGNVYVIETKLYKNPDKRTVLAQALDYGASLWRHSGDAGDFIDSLAKSAQSQFGLELSDKLQDFFEVDDSEYLLDSVAKNIKSGNIKFVILMDTVEDRLKDLIVYVNQNSQFDIYAVDLKYFKHEEFEIIIPKLYGSEVKKNVSSTDDVNRFDNQKIIDWLEETGNTYLTADTNNSSKAILRLTSEYLDKLIPARNDNAGGWRNGQAYYYEVRTEKSGWARVNLTLNSTNRDDAQIRGQEEIMKREDTQPKKPDWVWFYVKSWVVNYKEGEAAVKKDIEKILGQDIPKYEGELKNALNQS